MSLIAGPAPIVDFDGTLARLAVDWPSLRSVLGVRSIDELWSRGPDAWAAVTEAEVAAAAVAEPVAGTVRALERAHAFAVLSANSEAAVEIFLRRFPALSARLRLVSGRETLGGPKRDPDRFYRGLELCRASTEVERGDAGLVYVGDTAWELELARAAGAWAVHVDELRSA